MKISAKFIVGLVLVCAAGAALADSGVYANDWHFWVIVLGYIVGQTLMLWERG